MQNINGSLKYFISAILFEIYQWSKSSRAVINIYLSQDMVGLYKPDAQSVEYTVDCRELQYQHQENRLPTLKQLSRLSLKKMAQKEENMDVDLTHKQRKLMDGAKKEETVPEVVKKEEKLPDLLPTLPTSPTPMPCSKKQSAIAAAMLTVKKVKEKVQTYNKEMEKLKMKEKDEEQEEHEQIQIEGSDEDKDELGKEKELKGGKGGKMTRSKFRNLRKKKEEQEIMDKFKFEVHLEEPVHLGARVV